VAKANLTPPQRVPLLVLGFVALIVGAAAGLSRLGWAMPALAATAAALHGPLMICGFFGVVIALERAVAIGRLWAYLAPAAAGLGTVLELAGAATAGRVAYALGAGVLLGASLDVFRRQRALFTATMALGAAAFVAGSVLRALEVPVSVVLPAWIAFLVLTIAGERLELARFLPPSRAATAAFALIVAAAVAGMLGSATRGGVAVFALALLALSAWLVKQDIARRTVRGRGLTRFIAVCLLSGYAWLAVGAAVMLASTGLQPGTRAYDAALHAILLGFVFSMVFGHAPIIFPAVLPVKLPYHPSFYAPLALLHVSLVVRLAGDAGAGVDWIRWGGALNALALLAFVLNTVAAVVRGRPGAATAR